MNALMYPNPYSRTSGDIDVWIDAITEQNKAHKSHIYKTNYY